MDRLNPPTIALRPCSGGFDLHILVDSIYLSQLQAQPIPYLAMHVIAPRFL